MNGWRKILFLVGVFAAFAVVLPSGCVTQSKSRAAAREAYLAGQNAALRQQLANQSPAVTILGPVQESKVPWVAGLTLAQAVATANYLDSDPPKKIIITTRDGQSATLSGRILLTGVDVPLEAGDTVELK
jgi:hypothetical protein